MFRHRKKLALLVLLAAFAATPVLAGSKAVNEATSAFEARADVEWFRYGTGSLLTKLPALSDTYSNTELDAGSVTLEKFIPTASAPNPSVPWWSATWQARQCAVATGVGTQFVDFRFNSTSPSSWSSSGWVQSDYGDVRFVVWNGISNATANFWLATPFDSDDGHALVEIPFGGTTSSRTVCMYLGHSTGGQTTTSNRFLGQNWGSFQEVYTNVNTAGSTSIYVSNPTSSSVQISLAASGSSPVTIPAGATVTFTVPFRGSIFSTGSVHTRGISTTLPDESLVPAPFKATFFVSNQARNTERWCFSGPNGTSITITPVTGTAVSFTLNPPNTCQTVPATTYTTITSSAPVGVFHVSTTSNDPHVVVPPSEIPMYGIPSNQLRGAVSAAGTVEIYRSTGAPITAVTTIAGYNATGLGAAGSAPAYKVVPVSGQEVSFTQQADGNGTDTTSFLPIPQMSSRYVLSMASSYTAIACPRPGEIILVNTVPQTCSGGDVGKLLLGATAAGTVIESQSGAAFYLYYHPGTDETNLFVPRQNWATVYAQGSIFEAGYSASGFWEATVSTATDVWGLFTGSISIPAGTTLSLEVACNASAAGPWTFSTITLTSPLPHLCDSFDFVRIRAVLTTSNPAVSPLINSFSLEHSLPVLLGMDQVSAPLVTGNNWLWRIHGNLSTTVGSSAAHIESRTGLGSGSFSLRLVDNSMTQHPQVSVASPTATNVFSTIPPINRSSILAVVTTPPTSPVAVVWKTSTVVWSEKYITLTP